MLFKKKRKEKKKFQQVKTTISKMKSALDGINSRLEIMGENISEIEDIPIETLQNGNTES